MKSLNESHKVEMVHDFGSVHAEQINGGDVTIQFFDTYDGKFTIGGNRYVVEDLADFFNRLNELVNGVKNG